MRRIFGPLGVLGAALWVPVLSIGQPKSQPQGIQSAASASPQSEVINKYCVTCHNQRLRTAGLTLDQMDLSRPTKQGEVWEKVIRKLRTRTMPPASAPHPDDATYDMLASWLETELDQAATAKPNPGRTAIHRLNRAEYANAIRDLLSVDIDVRSLLPPDDSGYGFDNIADVLTVSPTLLDRYMAAVRKISRTAIGTPDVLPVVETHTLSRNLLQDDRMGEDLPFGSRGGLAVRHYFPTDGQYVFRTRLLKDTVLDTVRGLNCFGILYGFRGTCGRDTQIEVRLDGKRVDVFNAAGPFYQDDALNTRVSVRRGTHLVTVSFVNSVVEGESAARPPLIGFGKDMTADVDPAVERLEIEGPYQISPMVALFTLGAEKTEETPSRRKIFVCQPKNDADDACAKVILSTLARRAYRRPVTDEDLRPLLTSFQSSRKKGGSFDSNLETAFRVMLVSPDFLFRVEHDPANIAPGTPHKLSELELASRLSFFLWSSIPDDELLDLGSRGKLSEPATLEKQVRRMLKDDKSQALVSNFAGQWLLLRNVRLMTPNTDIFPDFDENLRGAFEHETELFFNSVVREDRSVLDFLTANYTFVNERLARHYGIPNVYGGRFRRVTLPADQPRGGLLGQGSLLMVTSYANRTSPVQRGKWVLTNILGSPPPAPPPNVPSLPETSPGKPQSMRERMEEHRKNPACASCHIRMDPIGFALDNFDAVGAWRNDDDGARIDASGVLPDGSKVNGPAELKQALAKHSGEFVTTLTENLLTYAMGRGVEFYDQPAVRKIVKDATNQNYRFTSFVMGIVNSTPFRSRRSYQP